MRLTSVAECWSRMRRRKDALVVEYGAGAIATYLLVGACSYAAILGATVAASDAEPGHAGATLGALGAAYLTYKAAQPLRIAATAAITPLAVRAWRRIGMPGARWPQWARFRTGREG